MKYYSEILNKTFDTIDALETAEREEKNRLVEKAKAEDNKKKKLEEATKAMEKAYQDYSVARAASDDAYSKYLEARKKYLEVAPIRRGSRDRNAFNSLFDGNFFPSLNELFKHFY